MTTAIDTCPSCESSVRSGAVYCPTCGTRLALDDASAGTERPHGWRWLLRRPARTGRVLLAAVIAAAVATTLLVYTRRATAYLPDQPVRDWFAALTARDTAEAGRLRPGLDILAGDFLHSPAYTPPADVQVLDTAYAPTTDEQKRPNHSIAYVGVHYRIATTWFDQHIQVNRTGTGTARPWILGDGATGSLVVAAGPLRTARIGQHRVIAQPSPDQAPSGDTTMVPPGQYTIGPDDDDAVFTATSVTVVVPGRPRGQPTTLVTLAASVKMQAADAVNKLMRARIDECAARKSLSLVDCPFDRTGGSYTGTVTWVRWTIRRYPAITLAAIEHPYPGGAVAVLSTTTPGLARVTYAAISTGGKPTSEDHPFTVDGDIRLEHGSLVWTGGKSGRLI